MSDAKHTPAKTVWRIRISGYGTFDFTGTEAEAEEMRAHKANWERGHGMKWRADLSRKSDQFAAEMAALWDVHKGVPDKLVRARRAALKAEALTA